MFVASTLFVRTREIRRHLKKNGNQNSPKKVTKEVTFSPQNETGEARFLQLPLIFTGFLKSRRSDLNGRPTLYESVALPAELRRQNHVKHWVFT
jgi:hypothetical protein